MSQKMERAISGFFGSKSSRSAKDLTTLSSGKEYPTDVESYELLEDCGRGVSATVYRSLCKPFNEIVAVKKMNLESMNCDLDEIIHEAQLMKNYNNPNVLPLHTSFVTGQDLWMVMPFISGGSVLHIIKYAYPEGLDEVVVATIMREVLKALDYVHKQGGIHRDIKAGNILVDKDGWVYLADFGVATSLERNGSWGHDKSNRMTFVGTPCWMAPEVMEQTAGYDNAADIWSFGISLLEMAHGHAPFAKFPPMKVLLMTLQNPPPTLDDKGKKHFSKAMRDVVTKCLQKDPRLRPTAAQLLEHKFFKQAKDQDFMAKYLMAGLPTLGDRVQEIRSGKAATTPQENDWNFARSQEEYKKGVSSWNFDVAALKAAADLEDDEPLLPTISETEEREGEEREDMTLTGFPSALAAEFLSATSQHSQSLPQEAPTYISAFATVTGQAEAKGAFGSDQPVAGSGSNPASARPSNAGDAPLSPSGTRSPPPHLSISREGSMLALAGIMSPSVSSSVAQKKGRFSVYEGGDDPPPISPPATLLSTSAVPGPAPPPTLIVNLPMNFEHSISLGRLTADRLSEDGLKREERREPGAGDPSLDEAMSMEPKKKGRFTVIENGSVSTGGLAKNPSMANISDAMKKNVSEAGGKPPAGPSSTGGPPSTGAAVLPRLQELMDQASLHHAALQKLVSAVQESERTGKPSPLLLKPMLPRTVEGSGGGAVVSAVAAPAAAAWTGAESLEELRSAVEQLRGRLQDVESENLRLKARNRELEGKPPSDGGATTPPAAPVVSTAAAAPSTSSPPQSRTMPSSSQQEEAAAASTPPGVSP